MWRRLLFAILLFALVKMPGEAYVANAQVLRFSPGDTAPVAYDPGTGRYAEGASFDPLFCAEEPCIELLHNIFEPLVEISHDAEIRPRLALSWERRDPRSYRFVLRPGVRFHNGEPFDARAVRYSLERASRAYGKTAWFTEIERIIIHAPLDVEVVLKEPDNLFLYRLGHIGLMLPPAYLAREGDEAFGRRPVGTGAFRFVEWDAENREVRLAANADYWQQGFPRLDGVVYAYRSPEAAYEQLVAGQLHLIRRLNPRRTTEFMQTGRGRVVKAWLPQVVLGAFNLLEPGSPLHDVRIRRAINLAVDREHLIRYGAKGNGRPLGGYTASDDPLYQGLKPYSFSPREARQLVREAGYHEGFSLSMLVDKQVPPQIENIIAASLAQIGIQLSVVRANESELLAEVYLTKFASSRRPAYDIYLLSMPVGTIRHAAMVPMTLLYSGKPNEATVRDTELDRLYEKALRATDHEYARELWQAIERYVYDQHLLFIGYQERAVFGTDPTVQFAPRTLLSFWDAAFIDLDEDAR